MIRLLTSRGSGSCSNRANDQPRGLHSPNSLSPMSLLNFSSVPPRKGSIQQTIQGLISPGKGKSQLQETRRKSAMPSLVKGQPFLMPPSPVKSGLMSPNSRIGKSSNTRKHSFTPDPKKTTFKAAVEDFLPVQEEEECGPLEP